MSGDFSKPIIGYGQLWPLFVFGVACLGVARRGVRAARAPLRRADLLAIAGWSPSSAHRDGRATSTSSATARRRGLSARGHGRRRRPERLPVGADPVFALGGCLLFAERRLEGGVSAFAGQAAALPGTEAERQASTRGLEHTEVFPLMMFAVGGMMLFPAAERPADDVRRARGPLAAALPALRAGPPPPAAQPGGRAEVLPARRLLLRLLPLRRRADLRLRRLDGVRRDQRGGPQRRRQPDAAADGMGMLAVGLLFKVGAAPFHAWTPDVYQGAPTAVTGFMAAAPRSRRSAR